MKERYRIHDLNMPVLLGSALRVPGPAYANWGITRRFFAESEAAYQIEWKGGSEQQVEYVIRALREAGLHNFSNNLRCRAIDAVTQFVLENANRKLEILELGAGRSTEMLFERLLKENVDMDRIFINMVEPSESRLRKSCAEIEAMGLVKGEHFIPMQCTDFEATLVLKQHSQDLVLSIAHLHHHAWMTPVLEQIRMLMKQNAPIIIADWHNSMWCHPYRVKRFLENFFFWQTKERDMKAFEEMFPNSLTTVTDGPDIERFTNCQIMQFWKGWELAKLTAIEVGTFEPSDDIWMLEGHRPVEWMITALQRAGFSIDSKGLLGQNPHQILSFSRLLMLTVAWPD